MSISAQAGAAAPRDLSAAAQGSAAAFAGAVVAAVGGFALTFVVARSLGSAGSGIFFQAVAVFTLLTSVVLAGSDTGLLRAISRSLALGRGHEVRGTLAVALLPVTLASTCCSLLLWWLAPEVAGLINHGSVSGTAVTSLRAVAAFLVFGTLCTALTQATRGFGALRPYLLVQNLLLPVGRPVLVLLGALTGLGAAAAPLLWAVPLLPGALVAAVVVRNRLRGVESRARRDGEPSSRPWPVLAREFWAFSSWRGLAAVVDLSLVWLDVLLVSALVGATASGIYATASRFVISGTLVMQAMRLAIAPQLSAMLARSEHDRAARLYRVATLWIVVTSWPLYLFMAIWAPLLLSVFGDGFRAGASCLTMLSLGMLLSLWTGNVGTVLLMGGRSSWVLLDKVAALAVNVTLNLLLVPRMGIEGAALAWVAAIAVDNLAASAQVRFGTGLRGYDRWSWFACGLAVLVFGVPGLAARWALGSGLGVALLTTTLSAAVYGLALWRWRAALELHELARLPRSVRRPTHRPGGPSS
ncbi:MAG: oligosaccharide flippase family protein [Angustibacter sp.]